MNVNGVELIAVTTATRDEILRDARRAVKHDADSIPAAAEAAALTSGVPISELVDLLIDAAPEMTRDEEKAIRRRAKKAARRVKDAAVRAYVAPTPDELSRRAALDDKKAEIRLRRQAQREVEAEEDGDRPSIADCLLDYDALASRPPLRPLVPGVVNLDTVAMLYAPPATYKTFLALWLAACVALGHTWAGRPVERGPVLYIAAEGVSGIQKRVAALSWLLNGGRPIPDFFIHPAPVNLTSDTDVAELAELVAERGFRFVVLDTLVKVAGGAEENDNTAMTRVTNAAERIKRAGDGETTVLLVHHSGKSGDYRGASALEGNVDTMLKLDGEAGMLTLSAVKQKDGAEGEIIRLRAKPVAEHDTLVLEPLAPGAGEPSGVQAARIEEALAHFVRAYAQTGVTRSEYARNLSEWMGVGVSTAQTYIGDLLRAGRLASSTSGRGTRLNLPRQLTTFPIESE